MSFTGDNNQVQYNAPFNNFVIVDRDMIPDIMNRAPGNAVVNRCNQPHVAANQDQQATAAGTQINQINQTNDHNQNGQNQLVDRQQINQNGNQQQRSKGVPGHSQNRSATTLTDGRDNRHLAAGHTQDTTPGCNKKQVTQIIQGSKNQTNENIINKGNQEDERGSDQQGLATGQGSQETIQERFTTY
ncbi:GATA zinc finger domain-containing protein 14 [Biomphalaria glabrata]|uniref:Uncharacterized protein n=1 Tax=Biomphalaria glabrata TaxID=6526 RepID=A0A2C9M368_BIOGL|nr:GATA zinc finger domain-containing protein 14-like [Biomphalaria glabrata]